MRSYNKIFKLKKYLNLNGFFKEAKSLDAILASSNETIPIGDVGVNVADETLPMNLNVSGDSAPPLPTPSESALERNGIEIIRYIAGTEAESRGEGKRTAEGNIYEVVYDGKRAIAKIVPSYNQEPKIWEKILEMDIPDEQRKYLPKIYNIIEDMFDSIIIMEVLEPFSGHMQSVLKTKQFRRKGDLFKNEEFIHEAISAAFEGAIVALKGKADNEDKKSVYRSFVSEKENIKSELEGLIMSSEIEASQAHEFINNKLSNISNLFRFKENNFISEIANEVQNSINLHFEVSPRPIPKYYSTGGVDESIGVLEDVLKDDPQGYTANQRRRRLEALQKEREESVYTESPESFLYSEKHMPETEGLFSLLKTLKEQGVHWSDVHTRNLMQRPETREPVVIDVGLYESQ